MDMRTSLVGCFVCMVMTCGCYQQQDKEMKMESQHDREATPEPTQDMQGRADSRTHILPFNFNWIVVTGHANAGSNSLSKPLSTTLITTTTWDANGEIVEVNYQLLPQNGSTSDFSLDSKKSGQQGTLSPTGNKHA